jgi:hypothetical protein
MRLFAVTTIGSRLPAAGAVALSALTEVVQQTNARQEEGRLGLHLVAMVVALHQGEVFAESLEGVGSTFVVRLPVRTSAAGAQVATTSDLA